SANTTSPEGAMNDPIVDEVRRIRDELAARFNYDLEAIYRHIKERERTSGRTYVTFPPRLVEPQAAPPPTAPSAPGVATTTVPEGSPATEH
ncbi:MAG: hypothetical protein ACRD2G_06075, partial [Terriglobia bacterium]